MVLGNSTLQSLTPSVNAPFQRPQLSSSGCCYKDSSFLMSCFSTYNAQLVSEEAAFQKRETLSSSFLGFTSPFLQLICFMQLVKGVLFDTQWLFPFLSVAHPTSFGRFACLDFRPLPFVSFSLPFLGAFFLWSLHARFHHHFLGSKVFFFQFCDVAEVTIIHKRIWRPNLIRCKI